jgi:hypothetical protein
MSNLVIFLSMGLLIYWVSRTLLLLKGPPHQIDSTLNSDLWWGRRLLLGLRAIFSSPTQLA